MKHSSLFLKTTLWISIVGVSLLFYFWMGYSLTTPRVPLPPSPIEFYSTQTRDDLQLTFTYVIKKAENSVLLLIYSLTDNKIIQALRGKSEEDVPVHVICDNKASKSAPRKLGQKVDATLRNSRGLMHQKILVIDGNKTWIGSANMTPTSLKMHDNLVIGFYSQDLADYITEKVHNMTSIGRIQNTPSREFTVGKQKVEMWFLPDNSNGVEKLKQLIQTAQKTIKVAMFTWTRHDLAQTVIKAKERGVDTQIVIDRHSARGVSAKVVDYLLKSGIPIRWSEGRALLHHKLMVIDDKTLVNGSANWTKAAFTQNDDCFIILHDLNKKQQRHLKQLWNVIMAESEKISLESVE